MSIVQVFLILLFVHIDTIQGAQCKFKKFTPNHTMCKAPNSSCSILSRGVTTADRNEILRTHNTLRSKVARGLEKRGNQPKAANMLQLEWDSHLAEVAQKHAEQCVFQHDCNDCRKIDGYRNVGQNIRVEMNSNHVTKSWSKAVTSWYNEVRDFNRNSVTKLVPSNGPMVGHYTQVVWADSARVGCGLARYKSSKPQMKEEQLYVCNYGPAGNVMGTPIYIIGTACSKCKSGYTCSKDFPGLCKKSSS